MFINHTWKENSSSNIFVASFTDLFSVIISSLIKEKSFGQLVPYKIDLNMFF